MDDLNSMAVLVAAAAVVVVSSAWYSAFATQLAQLSAAYADVGGSRPPAWKLVLELVRSLVLASVVAGLAGMLDLSGWSDGAWLGLGLWIGFPVVLWTGAVMWERIPPRLAMIHAGDWLLKLVVIAVVVTLWR